jgi:hypothetical protein
MKRYTVVVKLFHESFGGYDHFDGYKTVTVRAKSTDDAKLTAIRKANKGRAGWSAFWMFGS